VARRDQASEEKQSGGEGQRQQVNRHFRVQGRKGSVPGVSRASKNFPGQGHPGRLRGKSRGSRRRSDEGAGLAKGTTSKKGEKT